MSQSSSRRDLLCFSHLRWHFVTQRPQHLLARAAKDRRVFYFEEPIFHDPDGSRNLPTLEVETLSEHLAIVRPHLFHGDDAALVQERLLLEFVADNVGGEYDAWFFTPMARSFTQQLRPRVLIYDCMDELKNFRHAPTALSQYEHDLMLQADVVFTGGKSLFESKRSCHPHVSLFPSSIEGDHFAAALEPALQEPADQQCIPHPRAGFYGVIDERFDIDLMRTLAALRPAVHFVILGPLAKIEPTSLPRAANINYLGSKNYRDLPAYLSGWDVALLPFAMNEATKYISPTKTPEYLAAGRRVVSTPIRDVVTEYGDAGLVDIASTAEEFAAAIDRALRPPAEDWSQRVADKLRRTSWDSTWNAMQAAMDEAEVRKDAGVADVRQSSATAIRNAGSHGMIPSTDEPETQAYPRTPAAPSFHRTHKYDVLVVGAGFAGSVLAERLASQSGKRVLVVDKRDHIAGNAYDCHDEHGILIHRYGPHIFHTNSDKVVEYLSHFTGWRPYEHRVLASVHGKLLPVPINLTTINEFYGLSLDAAGMQQFLAQRVVPCSNIRTSEEIVLSRVGRELYEAFFRNYTRKQWGLDPRQLDAAVAGRIPVRFDHDDRYFSDTFQAMPSDGYTRMFERMLDHQNITVQTGISFEEARKYTPGAHIVYTGPIDEFFDFRFGALPYRSLEFRHENLPVERFQPAGVVNYPNEHEYTRSTEFKTLTGQKHASTSVVYEYPRASGDPYYPIPRPENAALYARYKAMADSASNVTFCGRLATYRYLNMDQVVAQALLTFERLTLRKPEITFDVTTASRNTEFSQQAGRPLNRVGTEVFAE